MGIKHVFSSENICWQTGSVETKTYEDTLKLTGKKKQTVKGFGGCFNEIAWDILQRVSGEDRKAFFDELFMEENSNFTIGRVPIGANDFSLAWYSCDEVDNDYALDHFNIDRDKTYTIPYIKEAMKRQLELTLFASPWSPPTWMKTKKVYNYGTLRMEDQVLEAYARYFVKFVQAYENEGLQVGKVHVQNEPMADQKFPSCLWSGEQMRDFIKNYLGPAFEKSGMDTEIWVGTINGPFVDFMMGPGSAPFSEYYDQFENTILCDKEARKYITGLGFQWGGKHVIEQTVLSYPELRYMQTESECGDGRNTWEHMEYVYRLMWHYFHHNVEGYMYWNMALPEGGISTWGWTQNSLVTVNEETLKVTYQPEFYLMKHFSHFVKKGAKVLETGGRWASNCVVFENPDGQLVIIVGSNMNQAREFMFDHGDRSFSARIEPHTIHTFIVD
ncbi:MAG: glycoside hydrolase family 30 protein [Clostridiales bacterium]|nr:glycoside hydrolase family 30 protein [Clostridiales bacterium]